MAKYRQTTGQAGKIAALLGGGLQGFTNAQQMQLERQKLALQMQKQQASAEQPSLAEQLISGMLVMNNPQVQQAIQQRLGVGQQTQPSQVQPQDQNQLLVSKVTDGGVTAENPAVASQLAQAEAAGRQAGTGLGAEAAGKLTMIQQAKNDLTQARDMLFNSKGQLKRGLALASNIPLSDAPVVGNIIPDAIGGDARKVMSRIENALQAKLRIETGAQANKDEIRKLYKTFGIDAIFDSSESAKDRLNRLIDFMDNATVALDPSGNFVYTTSDSGLNSKLNTSLSENGTSSIVKAMGLNPDEWEVVNG